METVSGSKLLETLPDTYHKPLLGPVGRLALSNRHGFDPSTGGFMNFSRAHRALCWRRLSRAVVLAVAGLVIVAGG